MSNKIIKINISHRLYPKRLKKIPDPPQVLYLAGNLDLLKDSSPPLAIVGTRRCSLYGKQVVGDFAGKLAEQGFIIVSGLAKGIDALAHKITLENGGKTIAVLGSGINKKIYPKENTSLFKNILKSGGLIVSEYPPGTPPLQYNFPKRNRIIAGLSLGVLVIEARKKSGALITADFAFQQKKPVFAIPGSIYNPTSSGCNLLIKRGAKIVNSPEDILHYFQISYTKTETLPLLSKEESVIVNLLQKEAVHIDKIIQESGLAPQKVITIISQLESKGIIRNLGGNFFSKNN